MPKLEVEFEITGFKLRIKGESEDVAARVIDVQRKMQGAFQALGTVADGAISPNTPVPRPPQLPTLPNGDGSSNGAAAAASPSRRTRRGSGATPRTVSTAIELTHDAQTYGFPREDWNTATKAMWLLYILEKQASVQEASAPVIAETFNKYFRRFKAIRPNLVARDLASAQTKGGTVGNNANVHPQAWYLLDSGKKEIEAKIREAANSATAQPAP